MNVRKISDTADEAAAWVARMDAGCWDPAREAELQRWLAGDGRRRGALLQAQAAWITADLAAHAHTPPGFAPPGSAPHVGRRAVMLAGGGAVAASLVAALAWPGQGMTFQTNVGEVRRVPLADGSAATINTESEIAFRVAAHRRDMDIRRGEAWVQVAKDRYRPFVVRAGRVMVQAVGTAFSVRRTAAAAEILVTEGTVDAWADGAVGAAIRLTAGERAIVADDAAVRHVPGDAVALERALAWRSGMVDLDGEHLADAVLTFNRYNRRRIALADPGLASERLDGIFRFDDPAGFARAVRDGLQVPVDFTDPNVIRIGFASGAISSRGGREG